MVSQRSANPLQRVRRASLLAGLAALSLFAAAPAGAKVVFPSPGVIDITDLAPHVHVGQQYSMRESLPDAVFGGVLELQRESSAGTWVTMAAGKARPWIVWIHWHVAGRLAGSQLTARFLLESGGQTLAISPNYAVTVRVKGAHR
ncbi:MAG: hypothetical protein ACRDLP_02545 [Solirubrobacteraceae bacterium]